MRLSVSSEDWRSDADRRLLIILMWVIGTIPGSIILSAQSEADLKYDTSNRTVSFRKHPRAFLILDGQHRVYGFHLAKKKRLRVPVVIFNDLPKFEEVRLFMDINTKQRPVPNELLLDIKRLAETETNEEAILRDVFDQFDKARDSPLMESCLHLNGGRIMFRALRLMPL